MLKIRRASSAAGIRFTRGPFLTEADAERRAITITLHPHCIKLRLKGQRRELTLSYTAAWLRASQLAALEHARQRQADRRAKRKGGR